MYNESEERGASLGGGASVKRRGLFRLGALATAVTGAFAVSSFEAGPAQADGLPGLTPAALSPSDLSATYAPLVEFNSKNYASIPALFAAAAAHGDYCVIRVSPGSYTSAPVRIDSSHVTLDLRGACVKLANGSNDDWLRVGANALSVHILGGVIDCNGANQAGTSHGIRFEQYTGAFRVADRSNIVHTEVLSSLTGGIRIEAKRIEIQMHHVAIRSFGAYGVYMGSTDCGFYDGAIGIGTNCIVIDGGANWVRNSGLYSANGYAIRLTQNAYDSFVMMNMIDNNVGGGVSIVGSSGSTLNANLVGNEFRGNSTGTSGAYPDIYLEQVRNVNIVGNVSGFQQGTTAQTKYAIQTGPGVGFINAMGNMFDPSYHTLDVYSDYNAIYARQRRSDYIAGTNTTPIIHSRVGSESFDRFEVRADGAIRLGPGSGALDTSFFRESAGLIRTDGTWKAPKFTLTTSGGSFTSPLFYFEGKATSVPSTGANTAYLMHKDNGSGKGQIVAVFPTGATQVVAQEP